jgi:hypothetical protein
MGTPATEQLDRIELTQARIERGITLLADAISAQGQLLREIHAAATEEVEGDSGLREVLSKILDEIEVLDIRLEGIVADIAEIPAATARAVCGRERDAP